MMNTNAPYLPNAPLQDELINPDKTMTDSWKNHINAIADSFGYVVINDRFNDTKQETPVTTVVTMSEARRDQLDTAPNGVILYNTTTNRFNFRENGAWVTFAPIPA